MFISSKNVKKYRGIPLIVPAYNAKKKYYTVDDIKNFYDLTYYLEEVSNGESYFVEAGIQFIKDEFGFDSFSKLLYEAEWLKEEYEDSREIRNWLDWWDVESKTYST